jgi:hypothetical protein
MDSINLNFRRLKGKHLLNITLVLSVPFTVIAYQWDGRIVPESKCYGIKEVKGITYQVNTCTGKLSPLNALVANTVKNKPVKEQ